MTGSISLSGLLGGTAGQIDITSLIASLMQAQSVPQNQLKDQLTTVGNVLSAYQSVNTKLTALQTAAQAVTDPTMWQATAATSSIASVVATSDGTAIPGATTFSVTQLARTQISTATVAGDGTVVADPSAGITITGADGTAHQISLTTGSAADVAKAINTAAVGVRASVVTTDQGSVLQLAAAKSGTANSFTVDGLSSTPQNLVTAQDAQITVGDPAAGGYTVSSSSNTFSGFIPGVTFSATAIASDVTITVASDQQSMSNKVKALVTAANAALTEIGTDTAQGGVLQSKYDVRSAALAIGGTVSGGTSTGASLKTYGIDVDKNGVFSFDATKFAAAYAADPSGTQTAVSGTFASRMNDATTAAVAPTTGSITQSIALAQGQGTRLQGEIDNWTTRLATIQTGLQTKYTTMETALAKLQSQQTYLTSMFKSLTSSSDSSSS